MSEIDGVPYVAIGADELGASAHAGDVIECDICGEQHALEAPATVNGNPSDMLLTYRCGEKTYVAALDGHYIIDRFRAERQRQKEAALDKDALSTIQCSACKRRWTLAFDDSGVCPHCGGIN